MSGIGRMLGRVRRKKICSCRGCYQANLGALTSKTNRQREAHVVRSEIFDDILDTDD